MQLVYMVEHIEILREIAKYQLNILNDAERIKLLGDNKENYQYADEQQKNRE